MAPPDTRAPRVPLSAVALTVVSLAALNFVLAYLLARAVGVRTFELSNAALLGVAALGLVSAVFAVLRWRAYVAKARAAAGGRAVQ